MKAMKTVADNRYRAALAIAIGILVLSLIPLYALGMKAHPCADDYLYGVKTGEVWRETHSLTAVLKEAWRVTRESYNTWQGNSVALFLMCLQPAIFGAKWYAVAPVLLLTAFVLAMMYFFTNALRRLLNAERAVAWMAAALITFCAVQFTYKPSDAFYWYNGGLYYTFFFSLSLFLYGLVITVVKAKNIGGRIAAAFGAAVLAFLVGMSNYSTALYTAVLLTVLAVFLFIKKNRAAWPVLVIALVGIGALLLSVFAPGTAVRQGASGESTGVFKALLYSFAYGGYSLADSFDVPVIILWAGLTPLLFSLTGRTSYSFKHPFLVLLLTFGMYCSQGTALFYARGIRMPPRMSNIIYFNAYLLVAFNLCYFLGWVRRGIVDGRFSRFFGGRFGARFGEACEEIVSKRKAAWVFAAVMAAAFVIGCVGMCRVTENETGGAKFTLQPLSANAVYTLATGEASRYDDEMSAREKYLEELPDGTDAVVDKLTAYPEVLVHGDIDGNTDSFSNIVTAAFYGLGSLRVAE